MIALLWDLPLNCPCGWRLAWDRDFEDYFPRAHARCDCGMRVRARLLEPITCRRPRFAVLFIPRRG